MASRVFLIMFVCFAAIGGRLGAQESHYFWPFSFQTFPGQEVHLNSPEPVITGYDRYYIRVDFHYLLETYSSGSWVTAKSADSVIFSEIWGPMEQYYIESTTESLDGPGFTLYAFVQVWVDSASVCHLDISNITVVPTTNLRMTCTGQWKFKATETIYGDLSGNQYLDWTDLLQYAAILAGNTRAPASLEPYDLDCDQRLSVMDLTLAYNFVMENSDTAYINWDITQ